MRIDSFLRVLYNILRCDIYRLSENKTQGFIYTFSNKERKLPKRFICYSYVVLCLLLIFAWVNIYPKLIQIIQKFLRFSAHNWASYFHTFLVKNCYRLLKNSKDSRNSWLTLEYFIDNFHMSYKAIVTEY